MCKFLIFTDLQIGEVAEAADDVVVEAVVAEIEVGQARDLGDSDGDGPAELVAGQVNACERRGSWPSRGDAAVD